MSAGTPALVAGIFCGGSKLLGEEIIQPIKLTCSFAYTLGKQKSNPLMRNFQRKMKKKEICQSGGIENPLHIVLHFAGKTS